MLTSEARPVTILYVVVEGHLMHSSGSTPWKWTLQFLAPFTMYTFVVTPELYQSSKRLKCKYDVINLMLSHRCADRLTVKLCTADP